MYPIRKLASACKSNFPEIKKNNVQIGIFPNAWRVYFNNNYCIPVADVSRLSVVAKNNADTIILESNP